MTLEAYRGRLALVSGAGDGIGAMLAKSLGAAGLRVAVQDIRSDAAQSVASAIGENAFPLVFDVSDRAACMTAAEDLKARGEALNLLWINAGVGIGASLLEASERAVEWAYGVNVLGAIWTAQAFVPLLKSADGPRHLGVTASSAALSAPDALFTLYASTKHGTMAVAEALRAETAEDDIGTTVLCPGLLNTDIWDGARARPERFGGPRRMDPAIAGTWREAKPPEAMWPHIEKTIAAGGGYLTCATDAETRKRFALRHAAIADGIEDI